ncbi:hypothetical protein ACRN89_09330 [Streptococcus mitis]|jgi:hypothetical protein|uniref:hypothetical protein n=1 Tax=Streptococcus mitis TaxID=28037 RepID=UPI000F290CD0|nr:MAG: hypothetical protein D8H99_43940 [Streptococcus sp.]
MKETKKVEGIGYFDSFFSALDISTIASALKQFALEERVTEDIEPGEILNHFISTIIREIELEEFITLAPQLFTYPTTYDGILEVESIPISHDQLHYLQENIDSLLQTKIIAT